MSNDKKDTVPDESSTKQSIEKTRADFIADISKKLEEKNVKLKCSACGRERFLLLNPPKENFSINMTGVISLSDAYFFACQNCGNLMSFLKMVFDK